MRLLFGFVVPLLVMQKVITYANEWTPIYSQNTYLHGSTINTSTVENIFECYEKCEENNLCSSINMNHMDNTCELKHSTKTRHQHEKSENKPHIVYMETRDALGYSPDRPIQSCKSFKNLDSQVESGVYWMKFNEPSSAPFQVFCDMTTDEGGWTLVYSYTFTHYSSFISGSNAVTPIPNWPVDRSSGTWVPVSTTTPLSESSKSAMDFTLWRKIGKEFLFKPNITNWVACVEGTGSLVNWVSGSVSCRVVKAITSPCTDAAANKLVIHSAGPIFYKDNKFQFFLEGHTGAYWPVHDPCSTPPTSSNHKTNVPNPNGALYIR